MDICLAYATEKKIGLQYECLSHANMVLAVPPHSHLVKLAQKEQNVPYPVLYGRAWMDEPYISLASHTQSGREAERYFQRIGRRPQTRLYVDDTQSALTAVENRLGNCLLTAIPYTDRQVRYLYLADFPAEHKEVFLVYRKSDVQEKSFRNILAVIKQLYRDDEKDW